MAAGAKKSEATGWPVQQPNSGEKMKKTIAAALLGMFAVLAFAHSGGTDKNGCHMDHKTGTTHCH
jgi:ribosomal protein S6E (S10)